MFRALQQQANEHQDQLESQIQVLKNNNDDLEYRMTALRKVYQDTVESVKRAKIDSTSNEVLPFLKVNLYL